MSSFEEHRHFLNGYYGKVKYLYDLSRKYYLFGRDTALKEILKSPWESLIEIGPGTGRNLTLLHRKRASAQFGGIEASDEMLTLAQKKCPWANLTHGFAETGDIEKVLGKKPDVILFSYCLSMVQDKEKAIMNARRSLAPNGKLVIVDFGDMTGFPAILQKNMNGFLKSFHVSPLTSETFGTHEGKIKWGPGKYYVIAELDPLVSRE